MNYRLDGLSQQAAMIKAFTIPDGLQEVTRIDTRIAGLGDAGRQHGLAFHKRDGHRSAYLGPKGAPAAMTLIDQATSSTPGLGITYQRLLSSIAHAKLHGLMRFARDGAFGTGQPGQRMMQLNVSASNVAQELLVGPMCASTLIEHLHAYTGWDIGNISPIVIRVLQVWGRIGGIPYSGPATHP